MTALRVFVAAFLAALLVASLACNVHDEDEDVPPESDGGDSSDDDDDDDDDGCTDADADGWCAPEDCNDHNAFMNPSRAEDCADGIDNNCDGFVDELDPQCPDIDPPGDDDFATHLAPLAAVC
ncbi:putative metal-binding motif-containing protein [bacterium]|nr:putative metal-binding motif-containing protein [bacterium]